MSIIGNKTGNLGEGIAELFLRRRGYAILHKNYWKPYGEIDIVAQKEGRIHFVEVKAVAGGDYHAEENVHSKKLRRLGRAIQSFLMKKEYKDKDWQFDICIVHIDSIQKKAKVKFLENELLPE